MKQRKIHFFQHVPFEGLGFIESWATQNNHILSSTRFFESYSIPDLNDFDWLIVMGGPMGVYDTEQYPWLEQEIAFIKNVIDNNKVVLGICLGSQLIAAALGAKVYPNVQKEIGWFPLRKTGQENNLLKDLPEHFTTLHWHGDTFDLPANAVHLLQTDICSNQAFVYNEKVLALQFHLEATPETLSAMIENCGHELVKSDFIQSEDEINNQKDLCKESNKHLTGILNKLSEIDQGIN